MRAVVQRVKRAQVTVEGRITGRIEKGILVLLGVGEDDEIKDLKYIADKIIKLRIFEDNEDKMNLSVLDGRNVLVVSCSHFTEIAERGTGQAIQRRLTSKAGVL